MTAGLVFEVTTDMQECSRMGKAAYIDNKCLHISSYGLIIKLADMLANITDNPLEKAIKRIRHHHTVILEQRKTLSPTHIELLNQIDLALKNLHGA